MAPKKDVSKKEPPKSVSTIPVLEKTAESSAKVCNHRCTNLTLGTSPTEHSLVCPINNRYACCFCLSQNTNVTSVEQHVEDRHNRDYENDPTHFVKDSKSAESI